MAEIKSTKGTTPSPLTSNPSPFIFPHSIQVDLFNYLKPQQQEFIKPILRVMKKPAQEELCCMLLDYMESGEVIMTDDVVVGGMFNYLTRFNMPHDDDPSDKRIIRPLHYRSKSLMKVGEIINRLFPSLKK